MCLRFFAPLLIYCQILGDAHEEDASPERVPPSSSGCVTVHRTFKNSYQSNTSLKHKNMTALQNLLNTYRLASITEREKGTHFEDLNCTYLRNEATYRDLYSQVWTYADWAREQG